MLWKMLFNSRKKKFGIGEESYDDLLKRLRKLVKKGECVGLAPFNDFINTMPLTCYKKYLGATTIYDKHGKYISYVSMVYEDFDGSIKHYDYICKLNVDELEY